MNKQSTPNQHQGEPVVSQCPLCCQTHEQVPVGRAGGQQANGCDVDFTTWRCEGCGGSWIGDPADPGEVERLRDILEHKESVQAELNQTLEQVLNERDALRAQLAERDALLRQCGNPVRSQISRLEDEAKRSDHPKLYRDEVERLSVILRQMDALSASAEPSAPKCKHCHDLGEIPTGKMIDQGYWQPPEPDMEPCPHCQGEPSAPVERDERADFEAWFATTGLAEAWGRTVADCLKGKGCCTNSRWEGWQARAALERKQ